MIPRDSAQKDAAVPNGHKSPLASSAAAGSKTPLSSKAKSSFINKVKAAAAVTITPLQILQMIVGSYAIFHTHSVCPDKQGPVFTAFGGAMYLSYLALFLRMFSGKIKKFFGGKSALADSKSPRTSASDAGAKKAE
jgi:hypothetical protein